MEVTQLGKFGPDAFRFVVALASRNDATSLCYSEHFTQRIPRVANVDQHLMTNGNVECLVRKGKLKDTALLELDIFDAGLFSESSCSWQDSGIEVDAGYVAVGNELGETHRDGA
jgi:hypothetical protein